MSIVLFLGRTVKEYKEDHEEKINQLLQSGNILCDLCTHPMCRHSSYKRKIKETGEEIEVIIAWCSDCRKWHALLPDFLLPHKHYSGNEIESVIIESAATPTNQIETEASESTVRRWISQIGNKIALAVGILKVLFGRGGHPVSEVTIEAGSPYSELEQLLEMASFHIKCCGNRLGLANLWLSTNKIRAYLYQ